MPIHTPDSAQLSYSFRFAYDMSKGVGAVLLPILCQLALELLNSHRIDNAVSPRQHELYIKVYRNAPRDASVVICLL